MKYQAISYLRYSSKGQARGDSERRQEESFNQWLHHNSDKYVPYEPFRDLGKSGYSGGHLAKDGSLGKLLQQAKEGIFVTGDLLVVEAVDRLTRLEPLEALELFKQILSTGLSILTLEDNQTYTIESLNSNSFSLITLVIKSQASHEYSKRLGARVKSAHERKRINAEAGESSKVVSAPWLKNGKIHNPIALLALKAIEMYLEGYGTRAIAIEITKQIKESEDSVKARYKKPIDARTIRRWLENPALIGNWKTKYKLIESCFEPLISYSDWIKIQDQLEFRKSNKVDAGSVTHYKLSGLIICHSCRSPFTVRVQKPKPTKAAPIGSDAYKSKSQIKYLNCSRYLKSGSCSNNSTWPYQALEYIYEQTINDCLFQIAMGLPASRELEAQINDISESMARIQEKLVRARKLFIEYGDSSAEADYVKLNNELTHLGEQLSALMTKSRFTKLNDGSEFNGESYEILNCEPWEKSNEIGKRKLLKEAEYSITINEKDAECWYASKNWTLLKRNQKSRTYTVKESENDGTSTNYLAINDSATVIAKAESIHQLSLLLDGLV
jgi:DNA invertase Pin-like site-specific DNA recombinase